MHKLLEYFKIHENFYPQKYGYIRIYWYTNLKAYKILYIYGYTIMHGVCLLKNMETVYIRTI